MWYIMREQRCEEIRPKGGCRGERRIVMKEFYINQLETGMEFQDFFMVKAIAVKMGANKKQYLDLTLGDCTGEISAKKWDVSDQ